jgi:hypothetical protein
LKIFFFFLSFLFAFFSRAGITISFLYADAEKNKTKPKYKYYIVVVVVVVVVGELCVCVCARSRFCLRRHHSCVNSLVRDERGGETGRKINGSLSLSAIVYILKIGWPSGRPDRQKKDACVAFQRCFFMARFIVSFDWLWRGHGMK